MGAGIDKEHPSEYQPENPNDVYSIVCYVWTSASFLPGGGGGGGDSKRCRRSQHPTPWLP